MRVLDRIGMDVWRQNRAFLDSKQERRQPNALQHRTRRSVQNLNPTLACIKNSQGIRVQIRHKVRGL